MNSFVCIPAERLRKPAPALVDLVDVHSVADPRVCFLPRQSVTVAHGLIIWSSGKVQNLFQHTHTVLTFCALRR